MYFVTFKEGQVQSLGLYNADSERIINFAEAQKALGQAGGPTTMLQLICLGEQALSLGQSVLAKADTLPDSAFAGAEAEIIAPIPRPRKNIFAIGLNNVAHNQEFTGSSKLPEHPIIFTKAPTTVIGPGETVRLRPDLSEQIDYEGELAVVIGKAGSDIDSAKAEEHIFGYTIINDITARDLQKRTGQWFMGKSLDSFCPMGPYLVHKSAVGWPVRLDIKTRVAGETRQDSNTEHLYFDIATLISAVSAGLTLEPGDIIATGTPEGVGMAFDPPRFLRSGDVVEIEIEKLGVLKNPVA